MTSAHPHPRRRRPGIAALAATIGALLLTVSCSNGSSGGASTSTVPGPTSPDSSSTAASPSSDTEPATTSADGLPSIQDFRKNPSDRLPVDSILIRSGHPYKGKNAITPHTGAHAVFGTDYEEWPQGGTAPENYPPIYAVADGVIRDVVKSYRVGENDRYGIYLSIATTGAATIDFEYSIEPMTKEPSPGFYETFLKVKPGDRVKRGDIIAYMYLPKGVDDSHLHFELLNTATGDFMAPAIFSRPTLAEFYGTWKTQGFDSTQGYDNPIPICMGWKIDASENPFENKAVDCLTYPDESGA